MSTSSLGTTVKVTPSGKSAVTVGLLRSVSEIRLDSAVIDVTPLDAAGGFRQYVQGFRDAGEITLEGFLDKDQTGQTTLRGLYLSGETAAFLRAMRPFLKPERQEKIDRAAQLARLIHLAKTFLLSGEG